jgi:hypothetical protein
LNRLRPLNPAVLLPPARIKVSLLWRVLTFFYASPTQCGQV